MSEPITYASSVNAFYLAFFGRPADPDGLAFWSGHLAANGGDVSFITRAFAGSEEAQVRFGNDSTPARIVEIYQQLFNRGPEPGGLVFWTQAVERGDVTLADVAISILEGAQGTDADLATLRKQAVADFTARVEETGSDYAGYAAVEAARVLVRAVTPNASQDDIAKLVEATMAFADIASNNPAVVDAIATGSTLLALFDTPRGLADPVTLVQALADVAKAAAGNPATLESLLRGGGMDQVLKVMPARASLQDVVDALAEGGLPAAIDVVYPPQPTTPAPAAGITFKFAGVDHGPDDRAPNDNVTNQELVDVDFSFTGSLQSGQKFQYSVDGGESWHTIEAVGKTLTVPQVDLWNGEGRQERQGFTIMDAGVVLTTKVQVRVADAADNTVKSFSQDIVFDHLRPYGELDFVRLGDGPDGDLSTGEQNIDATFSVDGFKEDVFVQWRLRGEENWTDIKPNNAGRFTLQDIDLSKADQTVEVRVLDAAGNVGSRDEWTIDGPAVPAEVSVRMGTSGLMVTSPVAGTIALVTVSNSTPVDSLHSSKGAVANSMVEVREQAAPVQGTLSVVPAQGAALDGAGDRVYTLGSVEGEILNGQYVWGFGGDDEIAGTDGDDYLSGGAGNDVIYSNGGNDTISGGAGADTIILINDPDEGVSTVLYSGGDTMTGTFSEGGLVVGMDQIRNAEVGDMIEISNYYSAITPVVGDSFLTRNSAQGEVAVIRGEVVNGSFYGSATGGAYMMQWKDLEALNSILFTNFSASGLGLRIEDNVMTLVADAERSLYTGIDFAFGVNRSAVSLNGIPGDVVMANTNSGLLEGGSVTLTDVRSGTPIPSYTDLAQGFNVDSHNDINFSAVLIAGAYTMAWSDDIFATETGFLGADEVSFAGGSDHLIVQQGFEYTAEKALQGGPLNDMASTTSTLYRAGDSPATLITGTGQDVVLADGGKVTLQYRNLNSAAQDLIVGFSDDDQIQFSGSAMPAINRNGGMTIDWVHLTGNDGRVLVTPQHEGAFIVTNGLIASDGLRVAGSATLSTLNSHLNVGALNDNQGVLILAHDEHGTGGALMYFKDTDDNGVIDAGEVALVAMFADGVPDMEQVILVGFG